MVERARKNAYSPSGTKQRAVGTGMLSHVLLSLCLALFILSASVVLVLESRWIYAADVAALELEQSAGMERGEILDTYDALIDYNSPWGPDSLELPTLPMSATGRIHFEEVKRIFMAVWGILAVTAVLGVLGIRWMHRRGGRQYLLLTGILTLGLPAVLGALSALNWEEFFVGFHHLFFRNDYWLFDETTDPVIRILPDTFFLHCAVLILVCAAVGSIVCLALYVRGKKKT